MLYNTTCEVFEIDPDKIRVEQIGYSTMVNLQKRMSRAIWKPAGRNMAFMVFHEWKNLGLINFGSPVINMGPRDKFLNLPKDPAERAQELKNYPDMSVCVGTQPISWYWNIGKLIAMVATTLGDFYFDKYKDELKGIITTSLWGKGSQYNRIYKFIGYTKGYGHEHISESEYKKIVKWLHMKGYGVTPYSTNQKMSNISMYRRFSGDKTKQPFHGHKRGIFFHEPVESSKRKEVIRGWYDRWGLKRYEAKKNESPPYTDGLTKSGE